MPLPLSCYAYLGASCLQSERDRIESAGGWITTERELPLRKLKDMDLEISYVRELAQESVKWNVISRVNGELGELLGSALLLVLFVICYAQSLYNCLQYYLHDTGICTVDIDTVFALGTCAV